MYFLVGSPGGVGGGDGDGDGDGDMFGYGVDVYDADMC